MTEYQFEGNHNNKITLITDKSIKEFPLNQIYSLGIIEPHQDINLLLFKIYCKSLVVLKSNLFLDELGKMSMYYIYNKVDIAWTNIEGKPKVLLGKGLEIYDQILINCSKRGETLLCNSKFGAISAWNHGLNCYCYCKEEDVDNYKEFTSQLRMPF